ncbi:O-antigen polymerase [Aerococcus urinaeequi]|uniref:O-antigen polymerase n=1 Tax=Aerococcus urinaeequi TaxID=51665 RepID=UPI003B3BC865
MLFLLFITLTFILVCSLFVYKLDLLSPTIIIVSTFLLSTGVSLINANDWNVKISFDTYFVIVFSILLLVIGEFIVRVFFEKRYNQKAIPILSSTNTVMVVPKKKFTIFSIIYTLIVLIWYWYNIRQSVSIVGIGADDTLLGTYRSNRGGQSTLLTFALASVLSIGYYYIYMLFEVYFYEKKIKYIYLLPVFFYALITILSSNRIETIYLIIMLIGSFYIFYQKQRNWKMNMTIRLLSTLIISFFILLLMFYFLGFLTGKSDNQNLYYTISLYIGSSIPALDSFLDDFNYSIANFGKETLLGLNNLLENLGLDVGFAEQRFLEFRRLGSMPTRTNIYTAFRRILNDYNYLGLFIYQFLVGIVYSWSYQKIKIKDNNINVLLYIFFVRYLIMQFTDERLVLNVFTITTLVQIFLFIVIFKYFSTYTQSNNINVHNSDF